jgi:hypothetical protein
VRELRKLCGATRLGKEQQYVGFDGPPQVISAEYELNKTLTDAERRRLARKAYALGRKRWSRRAPFGSRRDPN